MKVVDDKAKTVWSVLCFTPGDIFIFIDRKAQSPVSDKGGNVCLVTAPAVGCVWYL